MRKEPQGGSSRGSLGIRLDALRCEPQGLTTTSAGRGRNRSQGHRGTHHARPHHRQNDAEGSVSGLRRPRSRVCGAGVGCANEKGRQMARDALSYPVFRKPVLGRPLAAAHGLRVGGDRAGCHRLLICLMGTITPRGAKRGTGRMSHIRPCGRRGLSLANELGSDRPPPNPRQPPLARKGFHMTSQ